MILLTADFLAERYRTFAYHARGVLPVLEAAVACLGADSTFVYGLPGAERPGPRFDPCAFYALSGLAYAGDLPPLAKISDLSAASLAYFQRFIGGFGLIIGYELTPFTAALLEKFGKGYVNVWLHPVRFMDDELFLVSSNVPSVREGLARRAVSENSFFVNAAYAKAVINRRGGANLPPGSCVFFGQTANDKTLRRDGGYLTVADYAEDLLRIAATFPVLYYCRHPLRRDDGEFRALRGIFGEVREISENGYRILASGDVAMVVTISSSIGIEAYYFGKNVLFLRGPSVDIRAPGSFAVDASIFDPAVLGALLNAENPRPGAFMFRPRNKIRNLLDAYYAYPILKDHYDGR